MEQPVFKLPRVGLVGGRPVDRTYMAAMEEKAKRVEAACRWVGPVGGSNEDKRQLTLPFGKAGKTGMGENK